jgi:MFS family permease
MQYLILTLLLVLMISMIQTVYGQVIVDEIGREKVLLICYGIFGLSSILMMISINNVYYDLIPINVSIKTRFIARVL